MLYKDEILPGVERLVYETLAALAERTIAAWPGAHCTPPPSPRLVKDHLRPGGWSVEHGFDPNDRSREGGDQWTSPVSGLGGATWQCHSFAVWEAKQWVLIIHNDFWQSFQPNKIILGHFIFRQNLSVKDFFEHKCEYTIKIRLFFGDLKAKVAVSLRQ